ASGAGYLGTSYNPFEVETRSRGAGPRLDGITLPNGFTVNQLETRQGLRARLDRHFRDLDDADVPAGLDQFQQPALDILRSDRTRRAFDLERESRSVQDNYGRTPFGQSVLT